MEVMRDCADNAVIICSIENFDPMGVHTGDSITVAPAQTLTDKEYQRMRDASLAILRKIGVETGGSNVQFAVNPDDGRMIVIEMNPRVSRSSALASKATGFPIAKIAAKLAVGYRLDEIRNDITRETPACFEPTIDYVVTKIPRWAFEKFPEADPILTTQMKSRRRGDGHRPDLQGDRSRRPSAGWRSAASASAATRRTSGTPTAGRPRTRSPPSSPRRTPSAIWSIRDALLAGMSIDRIHDLTAHRPLVPRQPRRARRDRGPPPRRRLARGGLGRARPRGQAHRLLRPPARRPLGRHRGRGPPRPQAPRDRGRLQARRHLRRRVRGVHALLLLDLRGRGRVPRRRQAPGR